MGLFTRKKDREVKLISRIDKVDERLEDLHKKLDQALEDNKLCTEHVCKPEKKITEI